MSSDGHLYMQTNESKNNVIHYLRDENGALHEEDRYPTGGSGSGAFNYLSDPRGLLVEGAHSTLLTPDHSLLFAVNAADNSVSSFRVESTGQLTLVDVKRTGNPVTGISGTAKSLAYVPSCNTLYVLHSLGPFHIRLLSVDSDGNLDARAVGYSAAPADKPGRVPTMLTISPDERVILVGSAVDELPARNPDGSAIVWVQRNGSPHSIAANAPDPDGLGVFPIGDKGELGAPTFHDAGATSPWCQVFLHHRPNQFIIGYATSDGLALATLHSDGTVTTGPVVRADTSMGRPSELCWMTISPDDGLIFANMTGYGYVTSWRLDGNVLSVASDPACPRVPGDGTFRGFAGIVGSGPNDMWMTEDGEFLYQIYGNASRLIGYAVQPNGGLTEVTSAKIPHNSPQGLAGF
jgi:hypothetical protein